MDRHQRKSLSMHDLSEQKIILHILATVVLNWVLLTRHALLSDWFTTQTQTQTKSKTNVLAAFALYCTVPHRTALWHWAIERRITWNTQICFWPHHRTLFGRFVPCFLFLSVEFIHCCRLEVNRWALWLPFFLHILHNKNERLLKSHHNFGFFSGAYSLFVRLVSGIVPGRSFETHKMSNSCIFKGIECCSRFG